MASVTLKDLPPDLLETLRGEAEANHRSMAGEIMARLQRSLDAERATRRDQTWINEALESGPEAGFSRQKFSDAVQLGLANAKRKAA